MGLDVELVRIDQAGTSPRRRKSVQIAVVADTRDRFAEAIARAQHRGSTPLLDRIDIYGTLELTWDEMPQLLSELGPLLAAADDPGREVLTAVHTLAERCHADHSSVLRLVGD